METPGIGQGDAAIVPFCDVSLYVMTPEYGAASQLEKIDMLDFADVVAINKYERRGAEDARRDVARQLVRNREAFGASWEDMPVFGTSAARFDDDGVTALYQQLREPARRARAWPPSTGRAAARRRPRLDRADQRAAAVRGHATSPTIADDRPRLPRARPRSRPRPPAAASTCATARALLDGDGRRSSTPRIADAEAARRRLRRRAAARRLAGDRSSSTPATSSSTSCAARRSAPR